MFIRRYWLPLSVFIVAIVGVGLYYLQTRPPKDPILIYKAAEVEKPKHPQAPVGETSQGGHVHADGTWHEGPHEAHAPPAAPAEETPVPSVPRGTPFANFTPDPNDDPVEAAYKRLEYIKNNPHEWGDLWPQTLELMDEMTPMPEPPKVEGDGDDTVALLEELSALRDPRSAEILIKYQMESGIMGRPVDDALVAMGPASVPALIARLDDPNSWSIDLLIQIVGEHRSALGGIVEHIIIPKLEAIAASTSTYQYYAGKVISELQQ
ncbi:MAG: hypothetical protein OXN25_17780 [Candidatus Poribacteria bacterium]|nr:hypothetical protein [Candidatus Poribacteria bacterium]